ncbi:helix-turn-helix domain-containing protein [Clostridium sp. JNZ X4-2]
MKLGEKIRNLRKEKKISIAQLAEMAKLSTGLISQMERDLTVPSVGSLWEVAKALNVHINYFFDEYNDDSFIIKRDERKKIILPNSNITYELLSPNIRKKLEVLMVNIEPGMCSSYEQISHEGEECGYMIQGIMKVKLGSKEFVISEGDSIYYDSTTPHRFVNIGNETAISIWSMTPASY